MPYAIEKQGTLDLSGTSAEYEFDVGAHVYTRIVYVARARSGSIKLQAWKILADGSFQGVGNERTVGSGTRTRIAVFDNHRIVVVWLDESSALRARGYTGTATGIASEGDGMVVETTISQFDLAAVGVTTGVQQADPGTVVYYAYRHFALTGLSANGGWKLFYCTVHDSAEVSMGPVAAAGPGDKVGLACTPVNEYLAGAHPRKAMTLCRDAGQIKTRSWRVAGAGVTSLAAAAETKPLGVATLHGLSIAQNNDFFAHTVWPGASNDTARLQLIAVDANGAMNVYGSDEIAQPQPVFARLKHHSSNAAVAYLAGGKVAVAAWHFRAPGGSGAVRTVMASKVGTETATQVRLATIVPAEGDDPPLLVTLSRATAGGLRLIAWELKQTLIAVGPIGPIGSIGAASPGTLQPKQP
jgi:hypothetical protein